MVMPHDCADWLIRFLMSHLFYNTDIIKYLLANTTTTTRHKFKWKKGQREGHDKKMAQQQKQNIATKQATRILSSSSVPYTVRTVSTYRYVIFFLLQTDWIHAVSLSSTSLLQYYNTVCDKKHSQLSGSLTRLTRRLTHSARACAVDVFLVLLLACAACNENSCLCLLERHLPYLVI